MANPIEEAVEQMARKLLEEQAGVELVDVEYVKEHDWYLRVFIDKEGGIDIDDCQTISEKLEQQLDAMSLIADSYILEDFVREQGKKVDVALYAPLDGKKQLTGVLEAYDDAAKTVTISGMALPLAKVSQIRLHIDF